MSTTVATKKMNILVFDDSRAHREAAVALLAEHNVTVVGTYDEAQAALSIQIDKERVKEIMRDAGYADDFEPWDKEGVSDDAREAYFDASHTARKQAEVYPDFDVVMTDLLVPASRQSQGDRGMRFVGEEMPVGTIIALLALTRRVKKVAVITDMNHHQHPASAGFDYFGGVADLGSDVRILCSNNCTCSFDTISGEKAKKVDWSDKDAREKYDRRHDAGEIVTVKDWARVLERLTTE